MNKPYERIANDGSGEFGSALPNEPERHIQKV